MELKAKNRIGQGGIVIDDEIMKDFYHFIDSTKFTYQSISQAKFDDFKKRSSAMKDTAADTAKSKPIIIPGEKPEWTEQELTDLKKASAAIDALLSQESKREIAGNEKDIKKYLYEAFLIRHYGQDDEAYYRWKLSDDPQLKTAVSFLLNKTAYMQLLKPRQPAGTR